MISADATVMFRQSLSASPIPAVQATGALSLDEAAALRSDVDSGFVPYFIADRGRYEKNDHHVDPSLFARIREAVGPLARRPLAPAPAAAVFTRLSQGDYALTKDDHLFWRRQAVTVDVALDLTLDLSAAATEGEAQIVYLGAGTARSFNQIPGSLIIADRSAAPLARYERYLNHRASLARVYRLRLAWG